MPCGFGGGEIPPLIFVWNGQRAAEADGGRGGAGRRAVASGRSRGHCRFCEKWTPSGGLLESGRAGLWFFEYHGVGLWIPGFGDGHVTLRKATEYLMESGTAATVLES